MANKPKPQKYVVFMFNPKDNVISESLGEYDTAEEAIKEVYNLRKQDLPAHYCAKETYKTLQAP